MSTPLWCRGEVAEDDDWNGGLYATEPQELTPNYPAARGAFCRGPEDILDEFMNSRKIMNPQDMLNHHHTATMYQTKLAAAAQAHNAGASGAVHHYALLPDSPPDTDSGAGSTGSPTGCLVVDHTRVGGGGSGGSTSGASSDHGLSPTESTTYSIQQHPAQPSQQQQQQQSQQQQHRQQQQQQQQRQQSGLNHHLSPMPVKSESAMNHSANQQVQQRRHSVQQNGNGGVIQHMSNGSSTGNLSNSGSMTSLNGIGQSQGRSSTQNHTMNHGQQQQQQQQQHSAMPQHQPPPPLQHHGQPQQGQSSQQQQQGGLILSVPELNHVDYPSPAAPTQSGSHAHLMQQRSLNGNSTAVGLSPNGFAIPRTPSSSTLPQSTQQALQAGHHSATQNGGGAAPVLPTTQQISPPYPQAGGQASSSVFESIYNTPGGLSRKRLRSEEPSGSSSTYYSLTKGGAAFVPDTLSPNLTDDGFYDEAFSHQAIKFFEFQHEHWHAVCDGHGRELQVPLMHTVADKGFNYSPNDQAFINQKKNHFQITVQTSCPDRIVPKFVRVAGESGHLLKPIQEFRIIFFGIKAELPTSTIMIKQSQSDRKPVPFQGQTVKLQANMVAKNSVPRLHFSETTLNNQRKNGRANPDQKYFQLAVALKAIDPLGESYIITSQASERVIVRASNPGQFENTENEILWQRGVTPGSICYQGPVGIGTTQPQAALHVHGDLHIVGKVTNPSDRRLKENILEVDPEQALNNIAALNVCRYQFKPEVAERFGVAPADNHYVGIIAQEVQTLLPDAVEQDGEYLKVRENRVFFESTAAVKHLRVLNANLESKVNEVERSAKKADRFREKYKQAYLKHQKSSNLRRVDSFLSFSSTDTGVSKKSQMPPASDDPGYSDGSCRTSMLSLGLSNGILKTTKDTEDKGDGGRTCYCQTLGARPGNLCENKVLQWTIVGLVAVMALCLVAMASLYILEWYTRQQSYPHMIRSYGKTKGGNSSLSELDPDIEPGHIRKGDDTDTDQHSGHKGPIWPDSPGPPLHDVCSNGICEAYCCPPMDIVLLQAGSKPGGQPINKDLLKYDMTDVEALRVPNNYATDNSVHIKMADLSYTVHGQEPETRNLITPETWFLYNGVPKPHTKPRPAASL